MEIPDGMERFYGDKSTNTLCMNVPIYGTKQAVAYFYRELVEKIK